MVEIALVKQISLQSEAFFKAMTSHELLHVFMFYVSIRCLKSFFVELIKYFLSHSGPVTGNSKKNVLNFVGREPRF